MTPIAVWRNAPPYRKNKLLFLAPFFKSISIFLIVSLLALVLNTIEDQSFHFFFLILLYISVSGIFFAKVINRHDKFPIYDIGFVYVGVILLYFLYPMVKYVIMGYQWNILSDVRLQRYQPSPDDLIKLISYFLTYLISFSIFYLSILDEKITFNLSNIKHAPVLPRTAFLIFLIIFLINNVISTSIGVSDEYAGAVNSIDGQPLLVKQIYFFLQSLSYGCGLVALVISGLQYRRNSFIFWMIVSFFVIPVVITMGSRHNAVTFLFIGLVLYHVYFKKIATSWLIALITFLVLTMIIWGALRSYSTGGIELLSSTEFEAMFGTFYEMLSNTHSNVPISVYFSDFLSIIPNQLLPFEKMDPGTWYMKTFFSEAFEENSQIGYGFGVISEAEIGFGLIDLFLKAAIHGSVFASMVNHASRGRVSVYFLCLYLFVLTTSFRTFRTTSFELIRSIIFTLGPTFIFMYCWENIKRGFHPSPK